ncbi:GNAT family N-acetyltransferase [Streptoalloteichus hindustanus]|uniref:Ribosomal protein S18 acetylase RimI n=1 Tax=Streptoalloteichus hindustanus TaxID=2017 RepID=A0A1M5CGC5_STRHI|nr:GNAT family N-acetyltransferase [Streptoalloteichus hindustanus]SHF53814.1 Ribosomal protein S18 acetylase RimI [Streptoalloteichus hindustanus]
MSEYVIRPVQASDTDTVERMMALSDMCLGTGLGPVTRSQMLHDLADPAFAAFAACSAKDGAVLGVAEVRVLDTERYQQLVSTLPPGTLPARKDGDRLGWLGNEAVHPSHRRRGIGGRLRDVMLDWLRDRGCTAVYTLHWLSSPTSSSLPLLVAAGFTVVGVLPEYWTPTSLEAEGSRCLHCGPQCHCTAYLMHLPHL